MLWGCCIEACALEGAKVTERPMLSFDHEIMMEILIPSIHHDFQNIGPKFENFFKHQAGVTSDTNFLKILRKWARILSIGDDILVGESSDWRNSFSFSVRQSQPGRFEDSVW